MKIALVLTVKNESKLLRNNLLYHQAIGVSRAMVYFDGTTDNGKETIMDLDFVDIQDSVSSNSYQDIEYLQKFTFRALEHHTARQCLNTFDAIQKCQELGYNWLISIDADELITIDFDKKSNLTDYFSNLEDSLEVVNFKTMEVLQQKSCFENVFSQADLFKTQKSFNSRCENIYKSIYNPVLKKNIKYSYWYGQTMGKAAIRVSSNLIPINVHRYSKINGELPKSTVDGFVLHYHAYDSKDFIKKFRNFSDHPNYFLSGNRVESLKLLLKDVVNNHGYTDEQLRDYFNKYLMFSNKEVKRLLRNKKFLFINRNQKPLKHVSAVKSVFREIEII